MDDPADDRPEARFGPDHRYTWLAAAGIVVALLAVALSEDAAGRLLAAIAVAVLLGYVGADLVFTPRLTVSADGLIIRAPLTRAQLHWAEVEDIRADTRARFGLRSTTLEIDAGTTLAVLSRRSLGADPQDVLNLVVAFRP